MVIHCKDLQDLIEVTYGLMVKGATFNADTNALTVTLTGGF